MAAQAALGEHLSGLIRTAAAVLALWAASADAGVHVVIVEGLGGEPRFTEQFATQVDALEAASRTLTAAERIGVFRSADATREAVLAHFERLTGTVGADDQVLVYLIGHGSYDDVEYKFNIPGPDLTGTDISAALAALPSKRQLLVVTSSASGALSGRVEADGRTVILATRSGVERHATRFGAYFAEALALPAADTDKNRIVTAREAFDFAERRVADFFDREGQLATEHAVIDGELAGRIGIARLSAERPPAVVDTTLAGMIDDRDALSAGIDELRLAREDMTAEAYRAALLEKILELARLEDAIEARERELGGRE